MIKIVYTGTRPPEPVPGVEIVHLPMLERVDRAIPAEVADVLRSPTAHRIAVFYSQNAAQTVLEALGPEAFDGVEVWAVGEKTAQWLAQRLSSPVHRPQDQSFAGVVTELRGALKGETIVVSFELAGTERRLDEARLPMRVLSVLAYETVPCHWDDLDGLLRRLAPRWVVFASPRAYDAFCANLHHRVIGDAYRVAAIGPTTRTAIERAGGRVDFTPETPDLAELMAALADR